MTDKIVGRRSHKYKCQDSNPDLQKFSFAKQTVKYYSPFTTHNPHKSAAFTLAETLITLGIIGIVAAMTLPNLIANYQKNQTVIQLKKVYSDLNNTVKLSENDNGPMSEWNYPDCYSNNYSCIQPFIEQYWLPYFQDAKVIDSKNFENVKYNILPELNILSFYITLNSGVILSFFTNGSAGGYLWLFADVNGMKGPNRIGRDIFVFEASNRYNRHRVTFWGEICSKSNLKNGNYGCYKENTNQYRNFFCGRLIELNDWKIPDDYPW